MNTNEPCQILTWDSNFFGQKIARISSTSLNTAEAERVRGWVAENSIDCCYFLCDANDENSVRVAEENRMRFVDVRITFEQAIANDFSVIAPGNVRLMQPEDIPILRKIAKYSHQDSRYYFDSNFSRVDCDRLYEVWIERSCEGYADAVIVATMDEIACGYLTCHLRANSNGQIGLIALAESAQGKGLGTQLVQSAQHWFQSQQVRNISVVTQGRNIKAQRFYQKSGFITSSIELYYHWWFGS